MPNKTPRTFPARSFVTGIAALALAATGALAQPESTGHGGGDAANGVNGIALGNGNSGGDAGPPARGNGPGSAGSNGPDKARAAASAAVPRGEPPPQADRRVSDEGGTRVGRSNETARDDAGNRRPENAVAGPGNVAPGRSSAEMRGKGNAANSGSARKRAPMVYGHDRAGIVFARNDSSIRERGLLQGCPPGLSKKLNDCTPPGLDRRNPYRYEDAGWWGLPGLNDGRYRYYGGNLVRLSDAGSIIGYYPLLGGALSVGAIWPDWYDADPLPRYTQDFYSLGPGYRYADNVVYRTDPDSSAITSIAALLTGNDFDVGQEMPAGYDVYNIPYGYRDQYRDGPDARYRYSDGYVYQIDPTSQLIVAAIELLT